MLLPKTVGWLKRLTLPLLLTGVLFLTACGTQKAANCDWVKPIYFSDETLQWLDKQEWPPTLAYDLDKINKHNQKVNEILK